jgi:hypothetical protein
MCCIPRGEESRRLTNPIRDDHTLRQRREVPTWFPDSSRKAGVGDWTFWMWKFRKVAPLLALLVLASYADETSRGVTSIGSHTFGRARGIDRELSGLRTTDDAIWLIRIANAALTPRTRRGFISRTIIFRTRWSSLCTGVVSGCDCPDLALAALEVGRAIDEFVSPANYAAGVGPLLEALGERGWTILPPASVDAACSAYIDRPDTRKIA